MQIQRQVQWLETLGFAILPDCVFASGAEKGADSDKERDFRRAGCMVAGIRPIVVAMNALKTCAAVILFAVPLSAQWLNTPSPGMPRTADGKPNLSAPAPKAADGHPNLSGVWMPNTRTLQDLAADLKPGEVPYQPWAEQLVKARANGARGKDDPAAALRAGHAQADRPAVSVQDLSVSGRDGHPVRRVHDVPADFHRRASAAEGSAAVMAWLLGRQVGRRHLCRGHGRHQRQDLDGQRRPAAQRRPAYDRALPPQQLRHAWT